MCYVYAPIDQLWIFSTLLCDPRNRPGWTASMRLFCLLSRYTQTVGDTSMRLVSRRRDAGKNYCPNCFPSRPWLGSGCIPPPHASTTGAVLMLSDNRSFFWFLWTYEWHRLPTVSNTRCFIKLCPLTLPRFCKIVLLLTVQCVKFYMWLNVFVFVYRFMLLIP